MPDLAAQPMSQQAALSYPVRFALALLALALAVALRVALDPILGDTLPYVTIFAAVAAGAWVAGVAAGVGVAVLGWLAASYLFIPPRHVIVPTDVSSALGTVAYFSTSFFLIFFAWVSNRARSLAVERGEVLRVTLRSIGDAVITTDTRGCVASMNDVAEQLTGWSNEDALHKSLDEVFHIVNEDTRQPVESPAARALRDGRVVGLANHTVLIRKGGGETPIDDSAAPIRDELGRISGCVLIFRDVSEVRQRERDRAEQLATARLLASIIESSDDAIVSKGLDGVIRSWNGAAERLFGHSAEQAIGKHISLIIPPELLQEEALIISRLKAGQRIEHMETERLRADGRRLHVSLTISPIFDEHGRVTGASKIARDITERKQAEAERQKFVSLVENSTDFIGICDLEGVPFFINRAGLEMVGLEDLDEARRHHVADFFFEEDRDVMVREFLPRVLAEGHGEREVRFRNFRTGEAYWMVNKVWALPDEKGQPIALATVSQNITSRKKMEDDLRSLADTLSEADRRKNEFLAMLAHELRNPLAPISNAAHWLRMSHAEPAAVKAASEMLDRQVGLMARLVDDLLDMSRITRGRIELRRQVVELAPIVHQAVEAVRPLFSGMNHELTISMPTTAISLDADPARLTQIIGNLLNNACKFTDRGGHVWLTVSASEQQATISVRDNGIGIAREHMSRLFEMFAQVDTSLERSRGGLGIGLTLVKTLTEMHGGTVTVSSEGPGRGSEFIITLPVAPPVPIVRPSKPASADRRRVLIVDDSADGAESLSMLLEFMGHETHSVSDGLEAIAAAERLRPDVMLLDIGLPRMNGFEVCARIRQQSWGRDITMVAVTGWGQPDDRQRSREAGFDAHLVKPVDHEALAKVLMAPPKSVS